MSLFSQTEARSIDTFLSNIEHWQAGASWPPHAASSSDARPTPPAIGYPLPPNGSHSSHDGRGPAGHPEPLDNTNPSGSFSRSPWPAASGSHPHDRAWTPPEASQGGSHGPPHLAPGPVSPVNLTARVPSATALDFQSSSWPPKRPYGGPSGSSSQQSYHQDSRRDVDQFQPGQTRMDGTTGASSSSRSSSTSAHYPSGQPPSPYSNAQPRLNEGGPARPSPMLSSSAAAAARPSRAPVPSVPSRVAQPLLTPSQKKANHIASEQKRRASIRRGYEALTAEIPALREALENLEKSAADKGQGSRSKSRKKAKQMDDGEAKMDGRAGPKSEAVILSKTIEHLRALLAQRLLLREKLALRREQVQRMLPPELASAVLCEMKGDCSSYEGEWSGGAVGDSGSDGEGDSGEE